MTKAKQQVLAERDSVVAGAAERSRPSSAARPREEATNC